MTHVRRLEKIQKDFVGNVSHELKTPVTSLLGFTETLLDGAKDDLELTAEFFDNHANDAKRLQRLIQDIIELSKDSNDLAEDRQTIEINYFLHQQIELYQHLLGKNRSLFQLRAWKIVFTRRLTFFQPIIKNLLKMQFNILPKSQIEIAYHLTDQLEITVTDHGIGISRKIKNEFLNVFTV